MKTEQVPPASDEPLPSRRRWYLVALVLLVLSLLTRQPLLFLAAGFILVLGAVPDLWYRQGLRQVVVQQSVPEYPCFVGEEVLLSLSLENQHWLPFPWVQVEQVITPPLARLVPEATRLQVVRQEVRSSTWLLWSFQRVTRQYWLRCQERGLHTLGPVTLISSDPFGWLECTSTIPTQVTVLVYPLVVPLDALGFAVVHPLGEDRRQHPFLEDPLRFAGVRDYVVGDEPRRIHWKATAHAGALKSKRYDSPALRRLLLVLNVSNYAQDLHGTDRDLQEWTIAAAASLAMWALEEGYLVGLQANCPLAPLTEQQSWTVQVPFAADPQQGERLLRALACLVPESSVPLQVVLERVVGVEAVGTTVLLVSAATALSERAIELLLDLERRGTDAHLVLTGEADQETVSETAALPVHWLGGKEIWHALLGTLEDAPQRGDRDVRTASLHLD